MNLFNPNFELVWSLSSIIAYFLVFHFFWKPKPDYSTILEIKGLNLDLIPYLILVVIGYGFVGQPFWDCNRLIEYYQNSNIEPYTGGLRKLNLQYAYSLIRALVIAPILEEVFFRKFLFLKLLEKYKLFVAIIISSICFSAIHFETPNNLIPSLIFGVISCLIFFKTKNISYSILLHFLNNLCITLFNMFGESYFNWLDNLKFNFVYWTLFVLGILTIILGMKKITTTNKVKK
ncbi:CPBP family intramembrane glutamic endopeptidase [Seonamhaeicola aphaedonensis]|uniref:CPBP family intramembrane glutamic endopeptidase n=1 Tax=Seonamhaeicola aphaedonensis TaxID=1461338 RepID=UPI0015F27DF9